MIQLRSQRNQLLTLGLVLIFVCSPLPTLAFEWVVTPLGGKDSAQGPYKPSKVVFFRMDLSPEQQAVISGGLN
ncbi:hypothetical protein CMK14_27785 [Candidatus Poribacteria bacterium]|nr:hypothetical protein [Candidatus Poribacteria bacterium]